MLTVFSGKIYKIIYAIGSKEHVYSIGQEMYSTGICISRIEKDVQYSFDKQGERVIIYAYKIKDPSKKEFIYDEVYNAPMSLRRDYN